eukprot:6172740-Pleurochrysis_carterae.AAC.2
MRPCSQRVATLADTGTVARSRVRRCKQSKPPASHTKSPPGTSDAKPGAAEASVCSSARPGAEASVEATRQPVAHALARLFGAL